MAIPLHRKRLGVSGYVKALPLWSVGAAGFAWFGFSFAGLPWLTVAPAGASLLAIGVYLLATWSSRSHRPRESVVVAVLLAVAVAGIALQLPLKARFAVSAPAFSHLIDRIGPPPTRVGGRSPANLPDPTCPGIVGLYLVDHCEVTPGGYLFFDPLGNALVDYAGFAYLPNGPHLESNGAFELQQLTHIQGDWYAFAASW